MAGLWLVKVVVKDQFSHPECSTEVVNLVNRLQGGWNRICICAGRCLSIGRYPIAGSYVTHRSTPICVLVSRLCGCKYHRRVSLLSFQISRPVGLVPSQDSNAGGLPVGRLFRRRAPFRVPRDHRAVRGERHNPALGWSFARRDL